MRPGPGPRSGRHARPTTSWNSWRACWKKASKMPLASWNSLTRHWPELRFQPELAQSRPAGCRGPSSAGAN
eukprot:3229497-Alexandrium_andersonii.AAC.1